MLFNSFSGAPQVLRKYALSAARNVVNTEHLPRHLFKVVLAQLIATV